MSDYNPNEYIGSSKLLENSIPYKFKLKDNFILHVYNITKNVNDISPKDKLEILLRIGLFITMIRNNNNSRSLQKTLSEFSDYNDYLFSIIQMCVGSGDEINKIIANIHKSYNTNNYILFTLEKDKKSIAVTNFNSILTMIKDTLDLINDTDFSTKIGKSRLKYIGKGETLEKFGLNLIGNKTYKSNDINKFLNDFYEMKIIVKNVLCKKMSKENSLLCYSIDQIEYIQNNLQALFERILGESIKYDIIESNANNKYKANKGFYIDIDIDIVSRLFNINKEEEINLNDLIKKSKGKSILDLFEVIHNYYIYMVLCIIGKTNSDPNVKLNKSGHAYKQNPLVNRLLYGNNLLGLSFKELSALIFNIDNRNFNSLTEIPRDMHLFKYNLNELNKFKDAKINERSINSGDISVIQQNDEISRIKKSDKRSPRRFSPNTLAELRSMGIDSTSSNGNLVYNEYDNNNIPDDYGSTSAAEFSGITAIPPPVPAPPSGIMSQQSDFTRPGDYMPSSGYSTMVNRDGDNYRGNEIGDKRRRKRRDNRGNNIEYYNYDSSSHFPQSLDGTSRDSSNAWNIPEQDLRREAPPKKPGLFSRIMSGIGKGLGMIVSAPFIILGSAASTIYKKINKWFNKQKISYQNSRLQAALNIAIAERQLNDLRTQLDELKKQRPTTDNLRIRSQISQAITTNENAIDRLEEAVRDDNVSYRTVAIHNNELHSAIRKNLHLVRDAKTSDMISTVNNGSASADTEYRIVSSNRRASTLLSDVINNSTAIDSATLNNTKSLLKVTGNRLSLAEQADDKSTAASHLYSRDTRRMSHISTLINASTSGNLAPAIVSGNVEEIAEEMSNKPEPNQGLVSRGSRPGSMSVRFRKTFAQALDNISNAPINRDSGSDVLSNRTLNISARSGTTAKSAKEITEVNTRSLFTAMMNSKVLRGLDGMNNRNKRESILSNSSIIDTTIRNSAAFAAEQLGTIVDVLDKDVLSQRNNSGASTSNAPSTEKYNAVKHFRNRVLDEIRNLRQITETDNSSVNTRRTTVQENDDLIDTLANNQRVVDRASKIINDFEGLKLKDGTKVTADVIERLMNSSVVQSPLPQPQPHTDKGKAPIRSDGKPPLPKKIGPTSGTSAVLPSQVSTGTQRRGSKGHHRQTMSTLGRSIPSIYDTVEDRLPVNTMQSILTMDDDILVETIIKTYMKSNPEDKIDYLMYKKLVDDIKSKENRIIRKYDENEFNIVIDKIKKSIK